MDASSGEILLLARLKISSSGYFMSDRGFVSPFFFILPIRAARLPFCAEPPSFPFFFDLFRLELASPAFLRGLMLFTSYINL